MSLAINTLGRTVENRHYPGLDVTEVVYPPGLVLPPHSHDHHSVTLLLAGSLRESAEGHDVLGATLSLVFKPAGVTHSNRFGPEGARTLNLSLSDRGEGDVLSASVKRYEWRHGGGGAAIAVGLVREFRRGDDAAGLCIEEGLLRLASLGGREDRRSVPRAARWLDRVFDFLHEHFTDRFRVTAVAELAGVHPVVLARAFRKAKGCTLGQYVRSLRLRRAAAHLSGTQRTPADIALDAGFCDQSHFTRAFREYAGIPPARFRRLFRR